MAQLKPGSSKPVGTSIRGAASSSNLRLSQVVLARKKSCTLSKTVKNWVDLMSGWLFSTQPVICMAFRVTAVRKTAPVLTAAAPLSN